MAATKTTLRPGSIVSYHGPKRFYHDTVFVVVSTICGHYDLAYTSDPDREVVLHDVRRSFLEAMDTKAYNAGWKRCRECGLQYRGETCCVPA